MQEKRKMRVSKEIYSKLLNNSIDYKQSKYKNKKVFYNGIKFDSQKERNYYIKLKLLEDKGKIKDLKLQVKYELQPKFKSGNKNIQAISYIADFTYLDEENKLHIVDTKGVRTDVYRIKKKMMQYKGLEIEEV